MSMWDQRKTVFKNQGIQSTQALAKEVEPNQIITPKVLACTDKNNILNKQI